MSIHIYTHPVIDFRKENDFLSDYRGFFLDIANIKHCYRQCYSKNPDIEADVTEEEAKQLTADFEEYAKKLIEIDTKLNGTAKHYSPNLLLQNLFYELGKHEAYKYLARCKWIKKFLSKGHESPFEHASITFVIKGMSRSASHQLVRCRLASYNQSSQRYIAEDTENLNFILPDALADESTEAGKVAKEFLSELPTIIEKLKALGVKNEDIRALYPNATPTDITVTMNFRELKHLIELRSSKGAQAEIKWIVRQIWLYMSYHMPFIWDGICNIED